jgi:drug/metabolite transporter (DMT)-like permease
MDDKRPIDTFGAVALIGFAALLGFNQVAIKVTSGGLQPVFQAGLRSLGCIVVLGLWIWVRGIKLSVPRDAWIWGVVLGSAFGFEFICLFLALDITTVARTSVIFYSMPVWLALAAHFLLPGERLTPIRFLGFLMAVGGVGVALLDRSDLAASLRGDILALIATFGWVSIALIVRMSPMSKVEPVTQLMFQVVVSAPILMIASLFFGPYFRDPILVHWVALAFQIIGVASFAFLLWFWLLKIYQASGVASFSFLSPIFAVFFGWLLLHEDIALSIWIALGLVVAGLILINRR